jgi:aryl-alcohol dehydrogenase-like predicted oxidoreductase
MEYRRVGRTGLKVSEICLGTMTFGHGTDKDEAKRIVERSLEVGVNFFDLSIRYKEMHTNR